MTRPRPSRNEKWRDAPNVLVLRNEFGKQIESLAMAGEITEVQQGFLESRWLEQVLWMEHYAVQCQSFYRGLRLVTILGGVTIPALVGLNLGGQSQGLVRWLTFGLGLVIAVATALEEFFGFGDLWRRYRRDAEELKRQGWEFFQLAGPYRPYSSHRDAFSEFASRVEDAIRHEVDLYTTPALRDGSRKRTLEDRKSSTPSEDSETHVSSP